LIALSHDRFELEEMDHEIREVRGNQNLEMYLSKNRYGCGFVHVKSSKEDFLDDLSLTLELIAALQGNIRKKITIPAIGMGLWRADSYMVLRKKRVGK